jgi:hypothetical protein
MEDDNTTPTPSTPERPLGYWLRVVDSRISGRFADAFAAEGIGRREWVLLNVLSGDVDAPGFAELLARRGKKLRSLRDRGWVSETDGTWTLTDEGRAAKARLTETVTSSIREEISGAVSAQDFATTMASLEAIARRLGWDEQTAHADFGRRGFGSGHGFGPHGHGRGFDGRRHGFGGRNFGPGSAHEGFDPGEHGHRYGHPGTGWTPGDRFGHRGFGPDAEQGRGGCGGHGRHSANHAEQAYERGFRAGFAAQPSNTSAA